MFSEKTKETELFVPHVLLTADCSDISKTSVAKQWSKPWCIVVSYITWENFFQNMTYNLKYFSINFSFISNWFVKKRHQYSQSSQLASD